MGLEPTVLLFKLKLSIKIVYNTIGKNKHQFENYFFKINTQMWDFEDKIRIPGHSCNLLTTYFFGCMNEIYI